MKKHTRGQALVSLIVFVAIAMAILSATTILIINSMMGTSDLGQAELTTQIAESGAENALLNLLRNPNYSGETLSIGEGTATITVTPENPHIITSQGRIGNVIQTVQITADYTNILDITSWKRIF